jgi:Putative addiction module component
MNQRIKAIFEQAQELVPAERERLAELLLASVLPDADNDAAWIDEIEDRIAAEERGEAKLIPAADLFAKYRGS